MDGHGDHSDAPAAHVISGTHKVLYGDRVEHVLDSCEKMITSCNAIIEGVFEQLNNVENILDEVLIRLVGEGHYEFPTNAVAVVIPQPSSTAGMTPKARLYRLAKEASDTFGALHNVGHDLFFIEQSIAVILRSCGLHNVTPDVNMWLVPSHKIF